MRTPASHSTPRRASGHRTTSAIGRRSRHLNYPETDAEIDDPWSGYFNEDDKYFAGPGFAAYKADQPVSGRDGTARCRPHFVENCDECGAHYIGLREGIAEWRARKDAGIRREEAYERWRSGDRPVREEKCSSACGEAATKRCSACHLKQYCSQAHQLAAWSSHKAACKQLATQLFANRKLLAILTGSFSLHDKSSGQDVTTDLGNLTPRHEYTVSWSFDGKAGDASFLWLGYESTSLLRPHQPTISNGRDSARFTTEVSAWECMPSTRQLGGGSVLALANLAPGSTPMSAMFETTGDSAFFSLAINFRHFRTSLPWAPTIFVERGRDDDETSEAYEAQMEKDRAEIERFVASGEVNKLPYISQDMRAIWDPPFARLQGDRYDADCIWESTPKGCLARAFCPFFHVE
ncbi:hypothetical protein RQP46_010620 [Phenoliferia psychrophenolica]